ncbi:MAG: FG-GAP repeat domain-containing protein [Pirellulaceae bacterium]
MKPRPCSILLLVAIMWTVGGPQSMASPPGAEDDATVGAADDLLGPHRLQYRRTDLVVDLGVGLWAWPLPMDWDGDGDYDLVVSCPDVPFRGTYWFENPGGGEKMPVFAPPVLVGPAVSNATLSMVDGEARVLGPGIEFVDFRAQKFSQERSIYPQPNVHANPVRANQWRYVDYDGDQRLDLIVGVGDWTDYGWDDAFDATGHWTRGPLHGYVYLIRNRGTTKTPEYEIPVQLSAAGQPVDVYGMPSPNFADFDGDGDLDLLCGEFLDQFTYFQNVGSRTQPQYAAPQRVTHVGQPLHMDLQMIVPVAIDWDGDGDVDLVCGDEDGRIALLEHTGHVTNGLPEFLPPQYFQQRAQNVKCGALVTPVSVDWDADGDEDLICGNTAGYLAFIENLDGGMPPQWAPPRRLTADGQTIRLQAGPQGSIQGPCEAKWGYTTLNVADWNHDGRLDIVANSIWGKVVWFENVGTPGQPALKAAVPVLVDWPTNHAPPKPAWNWWNPAPGELATQWRTTPAVIDLDGDGLNDLVMLDHEGYLAFFRRQPMADGLRLQPGQRLFTDANGAALRLNANRAGRSGRRQFCFADWDGDGHLDLLVDSRSVNLMRNVSSPDRPWAFQDEGPLDDRHLAGHNTSPTVVDWNRDGRPDLLIGAEDGHLYYRPNR